MIANEYTYNIIYLKGAISYTARLLLNDISGPLRYNCLIRNRDGTKCLLNDA